MKALRRSLKNEKESKAYHVSITPKSALAILPPKKVIKALYDYEPEPGNTQELAFSKGDFFHVISREDDPDWYEACNPLIPSARGLVPVSFFETIGKTGGRNSGGEAEDLAKQELHDSGYSERSANQPAGFVPPKTINGIRMSTLAKTVGGNSAMVYGIVQYDFHAERPDELDAKAGEAIIVIAQSNPEWFVAKPIGRLGGPGLIPVSFIELRDMTTGQAVVDPYEAVKRAGVPRVEEWKKMTAEYKNSSISLGKIDPPVGSGMQSATNAMEKTTLKNGAQGYPNQNGADHAYHSRHQSKSAGGPAAQPYNQVSPQSAQQLLAPVLASIPRYCFDNDKYWYIIECKMEDGSHWELARYYHDFYDFQIALLTQFEDEAGNRGRPRTLPFMPGPVTHVTDAISNGRRQNLDEYIRKLLAMPPHISRSQLVRKLFAPRAGDFEIDPNAVNETYRLSGESQHSSGQDLSRSDSQQSSQHRMSASMGPPLGGPPGRQLHQRSQLSLSQNSNGSQSREGLPLPQTSRNPSSLTQVSSPGVPMKVKVFFQNDIIAIRVPSDVSFQQLLDKLRERLKVNEDIIVQYKDEPSGSFVDLLSDHDLDVSLQRNSKLTLHVSLA